MSQRIKILFLSANPRDTGRLQIDEELRVIFAALREGGSDKLFEVAVAPALRVTELPQALLREKPDIIHFSGHGGPGELLLAADATNLEPLRAEQLTASLRTFSERTRCVVVNACFSATVAEAVAAAVPCVIGMTREVPDAAAAEFASGFYAALALGSSVAQAFALGQLRLERAGAERELPTLIDKGGIAATVRFVDPQASQPAEAPAATGFAALKSGDRPYQPLAEYARRAGFDVQSDAVMSVGDINISGSRNKISFGQISQVAAKRSDDSGAAVRSRQEKRIGNLSVSGDENVFSAEQRLTVGGESGAGGALSPGAQATEAIAMLSAAVASSSELRPGKKASLKEILDALAGAVRGNRLEREYANGQFAQDLGELRVLLAPVLHLEIGTALKELEAALAQLRA